MRIAAIILASGKGLRAGGGTPKQWRSLEGKNLVQHCLDAFASDVRISRRVVVVPPEVSNPDALGFGGAQIVHGGVRRDLSVKAGLAALTKAEITHVLIHDAARPLISKSLIGQVIDGLMGSDGVAPGLRLTDALWHLSSEEGGAPEILSIRDRSAHARAQTPQGFDYSKIFAAHDKFSGEAADDVQVALSHGMKIRFIEGEADNFKITFPEDFNRAEELLKARKAEEELEDTAAEAQITTPRIGGGFDVHRFGAGDHVMLCGVAIPYEKGLSGHSDADVGIHALCDAIYGALAEGDIGRHFPPSEAEWKGAASEIFLRHASERIHARGMMLANADITLICEHPKIGPHAKAMAEKLAELLSAQPDQISVKATTSERLGFAGRGEGIAAQAQVLLMPGKIG